jgi:cytochrome oxidase Cu insertion factor (SCO1/SenC/PrrC family)
VDRYIREYPCKIGSLTKREDRKLSMGKRIKQEKRGNHFRFLLFLTVTVAIIAIAWYLFQTSFREYSGTLAPDFSLVDLNGKTFRLSDFRGRVVVIDFMATWCGPCRLEMSHLKVVWEKYGNVIVLISISVDPIYDSEERLRDFVRDFPYATWIWAKDTANLVRVYQVTAIPTTIIIDQDGYIRFRYTGLIDSSTLIQEIDKLLRRGV